MDLTPIRVLIVDDSAFMRFTLAKRLAETAGLAVVGCARDGQEALALIGKLNPDVVTLDIEMPRMDGLTTLREIMATSPRPVIMLSSLTAEGAQETIQALTLGAVDFMPKPGVKANIDSIIGVLVPKIQRAAKARVYAIPTAQGNSVYPTEKKTKTTRALKGDEKVVIIGASTGGPRALNTVISQLPQDLPAAVVVVQHMPAGFTRSLSERLDSISSLSVKEGAPGDVLEAGRGLVAPGGFHMVFDQQGQVEVNQNPPVHGVRPAVDVTMSSIVKRYGPATIGVVLTGMGSDGTNGAALIHSAGGYVIAEAESTSIVWGMPRSVIEAGVADEVAPLTEVAAAITRAITRA
jgi:two-component system chemotaxis response regulator CheB